MRLITLLILFSFVSNHSSAVVDLNTLKSVFKVLKKSKIRYNFKTRESVISKKNSYYPPIYSVADGGKISFFRKLLSRGKYAVARNRIIKQLSIAPYDYYLYYLIAESFRGEKNSVKAFEFYKKSLFLNPTFADVWKKLQDLGYKIRPRKLVKEKAVAERVSSRVVNIVHFSSGNKISDYSWMTFAMAKALWEFEGLYRQISPNSLWYRKSFEEIAFCYDLLLFTWQKGKEKKESDLEIVDEDLDFLLQLKRDGLLKGYLFFEVWHPQITKTNVKVLEQNRTSIDKYFKSIIEFK